MVSNYAVSSAAIRRFCWKARTFMSSVLERSGKHRLVTYAEFAECALILGFIAAIYLFAKQQQIWVDETTQLSGITLKFGDMLHWLSGTDVGRFGVPGDRMPPLSYILDRLWLCAFGDLELGFRLFHAAIVTLAISALTLTAQRYPDLFSPVVVAAFLVLSPKLIQTAVEIRAYPFFFAASSAQTIIFLRLLKNQSPIESKWLLLLSVASVVAVYTHFFGVVSSCAFFGSLALARRNSPSDLIRVMVAFGGVTLASAGIVPFALSAQTQSGTGSVLPAKVGLEAITIFFMKLFGDTANLQSKLAAVAFLGGVVALVVAGCFSALRRALKSHADAADWLFVVLVAGISATVVAAFFMRGFDPLKSSYSIWAFAPLALAVSHTAVTAQMPRLWNRSCKVVAVFMLSGAFVATYMFLIHAEEFVHGPGGFVRAIYNNTDGPKAVVYETGAALEWAYFPLVFYYEGDAPQYRPARNSSDLVRMSPGIKGSAFDKMTNALAPYDYLLLIDTRLRAYTDIRACNIGSCPDLDLGEMRDALLRSGVWQELTTTREFGLYDTVVRVLRRRP